MEPQNCTPRCPEELEGDPTPNKPLTQHVKTRRRSSSWLYAPEFTQIWASRSPSLSQRGAKS